MDPIRTAALVLMIISFLPLVICIVKIHLLKKYKAKATITSALVTSSEAKRGMKNSTYYLLHIQYIIYSGIQYSGQTIAWKKYTAGDHLPLMYLTDDPGNFKVSRGQLLKWMLLLSIVLIVLIGWFCYWLINLDYYYKPS